MSDSLTTNAEFLDDMGFLLYKRIKNMEEATQEAPHNAKAEAEATRDVLCANYHLRNSMDKVVQDHEHCDHQDLTETTISALRYAGTYDWAQCLSENILDDFCDIEDQAEPTTGGVALKAFCKAVKGDVHQ